jgi:hypothetical protein
MLVANGVTGCVPSQQKKENNLLTYEPSMTQQLWRKMKNAKAN